MKIGQLFHLTTLTDEMAGPEEFFNSVFSPLCMMRGYSSHWHRHAAIYIIGETSIEPMHVLPPVADEPATSWFRYMDKYGPRLHNMAFYVDGIDELAERFASMGVRTTGGGVGATLFCHPKDTPGMLEFYAPPGGVMHSDPRSDEGWAPFAERFWANHGLGLERVSHITVLVADAAAAAEFYVTVLDAVPLDPQASSRPDVEARCVMVGTDVVLELVQPLDPTSDLGVELATAGQGPLGPTFKVRDLGQALEHLEVRADVARVAGATDHEIVLDRKATWGIDLRFTDLDLAGDPRTA